jgi:hypothetical protein
LGHDKVYTKNDIVRHDGKLTGINYPGTE